MRHDPFVSHAPVGADSELVDNIRAERDGPGEQGTVDFNVFSQAMLGETIFRPQLLLPHSHGARHAVPQAGRGDCLLKCEYAWLLVCFKRAICSLKPRLLKGADAILDYLFCSL